MKDVKRVAAEILLKFPKIDILINNAAIFSSVRRVTSEGLEMNLALNYLSPFLLTHLLLSRLKQSSQARIINITSVDHFLGKIRFDDLQTTKYILGTRAYGQSKLALVMFTRQLAKNLSETSITVNAIHPGIVKTRITTHDPGFERWIVKQLMKLVGISTQKAAKFILKLMFSHEYGTLTGKYISKNRRIIPSLRCYNYKSIQKLWKISEQLTGIQTGDYY